MDNLKRPRRTRAMLPGLGSAVALITLAGCQSYERVPLELADHRAALDARPVITEPIADFVERLSDSGNRVPDRFDPNDGLSLAEGEVLAIFYNPDLRLARLDAGVALATFETAGLWEDTQFGFDGAESRSIAYRVRIRLNASPLCRLRFNSRCLTDCTVPVGYSFFMRLPPDMVA